MEMTGRSDGSYKEVFDFESIKSWITRTSFELQLPLMEERAKWDSWLWIEEAFTKLWRNSKSVETARARELIHRIARVTEEGSVKVDDLEKEELEEELAKVTKRIEEIELSPIMDFALSSCSQLVYVLQHQMATLVEPPYSSTERKAIVSLWSDCEKIKRGIKKLLSASAQVDELCKLVPELNQQLGLICKPSQDISAAAEKEEKDFAGYRRMWELFNWKKFEDLTSLSPMIFTHCAPGRMPSYAVIKRTLQIISIRVTELSHLEWPLKLYGIIAARDTVDNLRNPLFICPRNGGQLVTQQDPFLRLTGPSRAIVCEEPVTFEIQLKLKSRIESEDKVLMSTKLSYSGDCGDSADRFFTLNIGNHFCKMEFCCQKLETSVQATIVGIRVVSQGPSPFPHGAQVLCSSIPRDFEDGDNPLLLHDWKDGVSSLDGNFDLPRHVVSVELRGKLKVLIKDCKSSSDLVGFVLLSPKKCNFSKAMCFVGDAAIEITVAWSMLPRDDECILSSSYIDPYEVCPPLHPSVLTFLKTGGSEE